jgi:hypothetical protein
MLLPVYYKNMYRSKIIIIFIAAYLFGCTAGKHGWTTSKYQGIMLPVATEDGTERLRLEREFDSTINAVISTNDNPDYLLVESTDSVKIFYLKDDRIYSFVRNWSSKSNVTFINGIHDKYIESFRNDDQKLLISIRASKAADEMTKNKVVPDEKKGVTSEVINEVDEKNINYNPQQDSINSQTRKSDNSPSTEELVLPIIPHKLPREFINCEDRDFTFDDLKYYEENELLNAYCYCSNAVIEYTERGTSIINIKSSLLEAGVWVDDPQYKSLNKEYEKINSKRDTAIGNASRIERILNKDFAHKNAPRCNDGYVVQLFK